MRYAAILYSEQERRARYKYLFITSLQVMLRGSVFPDIAWSRAPLLLGIAACSACAYSLTGSAQLPVGKLGGACEEG